MNVLVLNPGHRHLEYCAYVGGWSQPVGGGKIEDYHRLEPTSAAENSLANRLQAVWHQATRDSLPDVVALRGVFGGNEFREPVVVSPETIKRLEKLTPSAPLHIPQLLDLVQCAQVAFASTPLVLVFETAFFVDLPAREHLYAVDAGLVQDPGLRRFGYHGILHEAAARQIARQRRQAGLTAPARFLSIVLEPRPELAAIEGYRPLAVTSGATPLEGLPGQTTCGEIDPSLVTTLARKMGWGPEHINSILTRESGLQGLVGEPVTLKGLFKSDKPEYLLAQQVLQYRLLQACGAGIAALGDVEALVFSGCYADLGRKLGNWLKTRLEAALVTHRTPLAIEFCVDPLNRLVADNACGAILNHGAGDGASQGALDELTPVAAARSAMIKRRAFPGRQRKPR